MAFTYFFRDRATLEAIREYVIPELRKYRYINIWDAGCAMGPEPYSLAIIFKESLGYYGFKRLRIYATDLDEENHRFGEIIAEGVYPEESVRRIPEPIRSKYFSPNGKPGYIRVADEIKRCVFFERHDLRSLKPIAENFGLVVCKNVLLHMQPSERPGVIRMFHRSLAPGGFLATEQTQKMPAETSHLFEQVTPNIQLFWRV
ncbi:MAG: chemotaxis protein CheR [Deltaproteobacteria bacterium]|nr:chemotaxis protein CheR [Deltaproteobacteria bacterium]